MPTITPTDEQANQLIGMLLDRFHELTQENEALTAHVAKLTERIAELEAGDTPPEGCEGWKRSNVWVAPLDERGLHDVRWADGTSSDASRAYVKYTLGVTFP